MLRFTFHFVIPSTIVLQTGLCQHTWASAGSPWRHRKWVATNLHHFLWKHHINSSETKVPSSFSSCFHAILNQNHQYLCPEPSLSSSFVQCIRHLLPSTIKGQSTFYPACHLQARWRYTMKLLHKRGNFNIRKRLTKSGKNTLQTVSGVDTF